MEVLVRKNPLELDPHTRLQRFQRELAEVETVEDSRKLLQRYLDPNAPVMKGRVSVAQRQGGVQRGGTVRWDKSSTVPGTLDQIRHDLKAPPATFNHPTPRVRKPLERVDSLAKRYLAEYKRGNHGLLSALLKEAQIEYWREGMPITMEALQRLAAKSLQDAEERARRNRR